MFFGAFGTAEAVPFLKTEFQADSFVRTPSKFEFSAACNAQWVNALFFVKFDKVRCFWGF
jgi:hypothetical protein